MVGGQLGDASDLNGFLHLLCVCPVLVLLLFEAIAHLEQSRKVWWQCQVRVEAAGAYQLLDLC